MTRVSELLHRLSDSYGEDKEAEMLLQRVGIYLTEDQKRMLIITPVDYFMAKHGIHDVVVEISNNKVINNDITKSASEDEKVSLKHLFAIMDVEQTLRDFHLFLDKRGWGNLIYTPLRPRSIYEGEVIKEVQIEDLTFLFLQHKIKRSYSYGLAEKTIVEKARKMSMYSWLHLYNKLSREFLKTKYPNITIDVYTFLRHLLAMVYINANRAYEYNIVLSWVDYLILSHTPRSNVRWYINLAPAILEHQSKLVYEVRRILKNKE